MEEITENIMFHIANSKLIFQLEYIGSSDLVINPDVGIDSGGNKIYTIHNDSRHEVVKRSTSDDSLCHSCRLLELWGIICKHVLNVLRKIMNIKELPTQYVLKRWIRDVRSTDVLDMQGGNIDVDLKLIEASRYKILMIEWRKLSDRAAQCEPAFTCVLQTQSMLQKNA
ncbi:hypothetical protein L1049_016853 [Liquidambar formosana]|uniref:Protein FAR1-RELATED SEQUENCE n=1 Tax=Liquidambar formosana TaxID=63359 RepID=A0AAP0X3R1_LIQFO